MCRKYKRSFSIDFFWTKSYWNWNDRITSKFHFHSRSFWKWGIRLHDHFWKCWERDRSDSSYTMKLKHTLIQKYRCEKTTCRSDISKTKFWKSQMGTSRLTRWNHGWTILTRYRLWSDPNRKLSTSFLGKYDGRRSLVWRGDHKSYSYKIKNTLQRVFFRVNQRNQVLFTLGLFHIHYLQLFMEWEIKIKLSR